ncbi:hypothetical protein [Bdellovibrio bacteriovorus]|uniref:hypothetical protein n=1 Tax=Bdellovibrio TaxID=958 RepID=UPI0035A92A38
MKALLVFLLLLPTFAHSEVVNPTDANGNPIVMPFDCKSDVYSSIKFICDSLGSIGVSVCNASTEVCNRSNQEIFTGLNIELASPGNIKKWTGFGGLGEIYQAAGVCLMRDLKFTPINTSVSTSTPLGNFSFKQELRFLSFDRTSRKMEGYHRSKVCAPVVGCLDMFTQKFKLSSVKTNLMGSGLKAGEYDMHGSYAIDFQAEGNLQTLSVEIPALNVPTPYGVVSARPQFDFGKAIGWAPAPYAGNFQSLVTPDFKTLDLYGRNNGVIMSQVYPFDTVFNDRRLDFRHIGWISQMAIGSRDANPATTPWLPPTGVEFPVRPDYNLTVARGPLEKTPNAYLGANVKVSYSPTALLPDAVKNNGLLAIDFTVFVNPNLKFAGTSQYNFWNSELSQWSGVAGDYRPFQFDNYRSIFLYTGVSASSRFALEAGVDLKIHLHVPLPWPFDDIDIDLINVHPRSDIVDSTTTQYKTNAAAPTALSQASKIVTTGKIFQTYKTWAGTTTDGSTHIQQCLAQDTPPNSPPPPPEYQPGEPSDLTKNIRYPCNICVGMRSHTYSTPFGGTQTVPGFIQLLFPSTTNNRPASVKWTCNRITQVGCYDMCKYVPSTGALIVEKTAIEMIAKGELKGARCLRN